MGRICRGLAPGQTAVIFQQDSLIGAAQQADSLCLCVHVLGGQQLHLQGAGCGNAVVHQLYGGVGLHIGVHGVLHTGIGQYLTDPGSGTLDVFCLLYTSRCV